MNQLQASWYVKHFECVKALAEGKIIQYKSKYNGWIECSEPAFSSSCEYRIKPEPVKVKVALFKNGDTITSFTPNESNISSNWNRVSDWIEIEVKEEVCTCSK